MLSNEKTHNNFQIMDASTILTQCVRLDHSGTIAIPSQYTVLITSYIELHDWNPKSPDNYYSQDGFNANFSSFNGINVRQCNFSVYKLSKPMMMSRDVAACLYKFFLEDVFNKMLLTNYAFIAENVTAMSPQNEITYSIKSHYIKSDPIDKQSYVWSLVEQIYSLYLQNKRYSVMFFNFNESQQNIFIRYMQKIMTNNRKITTVWDNIDLTAESFSLNNILEYTSRESPTIGVYRNILDVYKDATHPTNQNIVRHSMNKTSLNQIFDKIGDTTGAISFVFCQCSSDELYNQTKAWETEMDAKFESMYRTGRIDATVEMITHNTLNLTNKDDDSIFLFNTISSYHNDEIIDNILDDYVDDGYDSASSSPPYMKSVDSDNDNDDDDLLTESHDHHECGILHQNYDQSDPLSCY